MSEIYRRYNPSQQPNQSPHTYPSKPQPQAHQNTPHNHLQNRTPSPKPSAPPQNVVSNHHNPSQPHQKVQNPPAPQKPKPERKPLGFLYNLIPSTIYNPSSKKVLGIMSCEDLLLLALIFLFLENNDEDNSLMVLALLYVLLSDYIDFGEFSF